MRSEEPIDGFVYSDLSLLEDYLELPSSMLEVVKQSTLLSTFFRRDRLTSSENLILVCVLDEISLLVEF
jgi:hypothetical protein